MSTLLTICTLLALLGIILIILEFIVDTNTGWLFFTGIIIFTGLFGFLFVGTVDTYYSKTEQIPIDTIVKSSTVLYVELTNGERLEYISKKEYDEINMNTKIYKVTNFNHYSQEINTYYLLDTIKTE